MLKKVIREKDKEKLDMNVFKELGKDLNYKDILQVDGAFSACHINYGKSLKFNGADSKNMAQNSRKNSLTENGHIDDLEAVQYDFNGTEKDFKKQDIILLWEKYWLEYINAFNKLVAELPDSIVTVYVGRHAIELGFKYLMTKKNIKINMLMQKGTGRKPFLYYFFIISQLFFLFCFFSPFFSRKEREKKKENNNP